MELATSGVVVSLWLVHGSVLATAGPIPASDQVRELWVHFLILHIFMKDSKRKTRLWFKRGSLKAPVGLLTRGFCRETGGFSPVESEEVS